LDIVGLRKRIEEICNVMVKAEDFLIDVRNDAYGHSEGDAIEELLKNMFLDQGCNVFYTKDYVKKVFEITGRNKSDLDAMLKKLWWSSLPLYSLQQKKNFLNGKEIGNYQQAGADIVLFYGSEIEKEPEKIILINAKSHNIERKSRAPNLISAQRLLNFCKDLLENDMLDYAQYWFIGVNHKPISNNLSRIDEIFIKDLFKMDMNYISQINFDAAIQIQEHVENIHEIDNQTKKEFILKLSNMFINAWYKHSGNKTKKYEKLINEIKSYY